MPRDLDLSIRGGWQDVTSPDRLHSIIASSSLWFVQLDHCEAVLSDRVRFERVMVTNSGQREHRFTTETTLLHAPLYHSPWSGRGRGLGNL